MDPLTFALEFSRVWAMPVGFIVCIWLLRQPLSELLPTLARLRYKDEQREFHAEFDKKLASAEAHADKAQLPPADTTPALPAPVPSTAGPVSVTAAQLADTSPYAAVLFAWQQLEIAARDALARSGDPEPTDGRLDVKLAQRGLLPIDAIHLLDELSILRDQVARRAEAELSRTQAVEYARLVDRLIITLQLPDDAVALGAISRRTGATGDRDTKVGTSPLTAVYAEDGKAPDKPT